MSASNRFRNTTGRGTQNKMQRLRDRAARWSAKIERRRQDWAEKRAIRIERYRRAFRGSWISRLGLGLMAIIAAVLDKAPLTIERNPRPIAPFAMALPFSLRHKKRKKSQRRSTVRTGTRLETLENRRVLAASISTIATDGFINESEQNAAVVVGTGANPGDDIAIFANDIGNSSTAPALGSATAEPDGSFSVTLDVSSLDDGTLEFTGQNITASAQISLVTAVKDVDPPTVNPFPVTSDDVINISESSSVSTNVAVSGAAPGSTISVSYVGTGSAAGFSVVANPAIAADGTGNFAGASSPVDLSNATTGLVTGDTLDVVVVAVDQAGNQTSETRSISIDFTPPTTPTIDAPAAGAVFNGAQYGAVTVSGTADPSTTVEVLFQDSSASQISVPGVSVDASGNYSLTEDLSSLDDGPVQIIVTAFDDADNPASTNSNITLDATPPVLTVTDIAGDPAATALIDASEVAAVAIVGTSDEIGSTVTVTASDGVNTDVTGTATVDASGDYTVTLDLTSLNDGVDVITIEAVNEDAAGNSFTVTVSDVDKDASPPDVQITTPGAGVSISASEASSLTIAGSGAEPNLPVSLTITDSIGGTLLIPSPTADASGNFTVSVDVSTLADGPLTIVVSSTDGSGNVSTDTINVTLDQAAPGVPAVTALADDDGPLATPGVTNDNTIVVSGTASEAGPIEIFANGSSVGTGTATSDGSGGFVFSITTSALADATYSFTAEATDAAGNPSGQSSAFGNITVDTAAPTLTIVDPSAGDVVNATDALTLTVQGTVTGAATVSLTFTDAIGNSVNPSAITAAAYSGGTDFDITSLDDGTITLDAVAFDAAGNSTSASVTFELDTTTSTPTIALPIAVDNEVNIAEAPTVQVNGAGADAGSTVVVTFSGDAGGSTTETATANAAGGFVVTADLSSANGFVDGETVTITAVSTDPAGNSATSAAVVVPLDLTAPNPVTGTIEGDNYINASEVATVELQGTGAEPNRDVVITFDDTGAGSAATPTITATVTADASGDYELDQSTLVNTDVDLSSLKDGPLVITVTSADDAGNTTTETITGVVKDTVSAVASVLSVTSGDGNSTINAGEVSGVELDLFSFDPAPGSGLAGDISVEFEDSSGVTVGPITVPASVLASLGPVDLSSLSDGPVTVTLSVADVAGNAPGVSTFGLSLDTTAPVVMIDIPIEGDGVANAEEVDDVLISGSASEGTVVAILFTGAGGQTFSTSAPVDGSGVFTLLGSEVDLGPDGADFADGPVTVSASTIDAAGNPGATSRTFLIDTEAPAITIQTPISGNGYVNAVEASSVAINGTDAEPNEDVTVTFTDAAGNDVQVTVTADASGNYDLAGGDEANLSTLVDGTVTVSAESTDPAGNTGGTSATFTLDRAAPNLLINDVAGDNTVNDAESTGVTISGSGADPNAGVQITIPGANNSPFSTTADATGNFSITVDFDAESVPDGPLTITASSSDAAGNSGSETRGVEVDTVAPSLTITGGNFTGEISATEALNVTISGTVSDPTPNTGVLTGQTVSLKFTDDDGTNSTEVSVSGTVSADGSIYVFSTSGVDISGLSDGNINLEMITVTDLAGNTFTTSVNNFAVLDTVAPADPTIDSANASLANGSITSDNMPTIKGTAEANSDVEVFVDGVSAGTATADGSGDFSFPIPFPSALNDGVRVFTAVSTDAAGNDSGVSNSFSLEIDTTAPPLMLDSPLAGDDVINDLEQDAVTISGTGADAGMTVTISVSDSTNTVPGTAVADASGVFAVTLDLSSLSDGTDHITVSVSGTDVAGNVGSDLLEDISKDTIAPAPVITTPIEGDDAVSADEVADVDVAGTAAEPGGIVLVTFTDQNGATVTKTVVADVAGNFDLDPNRLADLSGLAEGTVTVAVTSFDAAQNIGTSTRSITLDVTVPNLDIDVPISSDGFVNASEANTFSFSGTGAEEAVTDITLTDNASPTPNVVTVSDVIPNGNGTFTVSVGSLGALDDGEITISITNQDPYGNETTTTETFILDTAVPAPVITTPIEGDDIVSASESGDVFVEGEGAEPLADVVITFTDTATPNANVVTRTVQADANGDFSLSGEEVDLSGLVEGNVHVEVSSTDQAQNEGTDSHTILLDTVIDQIAINTPIEGDDIVIATEASGVIVTGTAAEPGATVSVVFADTDGGTADVVRTVTANGSGNWSLVSNQADLTTLTDGMITVTASNQDAAGNQSSASVAILLDTTAPDIALDSPIASDDVISSAEQSAVTISGTTNGSEDVTIEISDGGTVIRSETVTPSGGTFSFTFDLTDTPASTDGPLGVTVSSSDPLGNVGTDSATIIQDTVAPAVPTVDVADDDGGLSDGAVTNDTTLTVSGITEANASVAISANGTLLDTVTADATGAYTFTTDALTPDGDYTFSAVATDAAGNSSSSASGSDPTITVDTIAPAITLETLIAGDDFINAAEAATGITVSGQTEPNLSVQVIFLQGATSVSKNATADGNGDFSVSLTPGNISGFSEGNVNIIASSTDPATNTGSDNATVKIDTVAPALALTSPTSGQVVSGTTGTVVSLAGTGGDGDVDISISDGTDSVDVSLTAMANGNFGVTLANLVSLADGPLTLTATTADDAGNEANVTFSLLKDTQGPTPSIDSPIEGDDVIGPAEVADVEVTGGGAEPGQPVTVSFTDVSGNVVTAFGAANGNGDYILNTPANLGGLDDGDITVTVSTADANGNVGTATTSVTKDVTAPAVTTNALSAFAGGTTPLTTATLTATDAVSGPADITYTVTTLPSHGILVNTASASPNAPIATFTQADLDAGNISYVHAGSTLPTDSFVVSVADEAGNSTTATVNIGTQLVTLATVESVVINGGDQTRSQLTSLTVTFSSEVTIQPDAFTVEKRDDLPSGPETVGVVTNLIVGTPVNSGGKTTVEITFDNSGTFRGPGGMLEDGNYQLTVDSAKVSSVAGGLPLDGNGNGSNDTNDDYVFGDEAVDNFYRLFGDVVGSPTPGFGAVDAPDLNEIIPVLTSPSANYRADLDYDNDGDIDAADITEIANRVFAIRNTDGF